MESILLFVCGFQTGLSYSRSGLTSALNADSRFSVSSCDVSSDEAEDLLCFADINIPLEILGERRSKIFDTVLAL